MRNWREIRSDIYDALADYDVDVEYHRPSGNGWNASCSYFSISFNDEWDWEWIENDINNVCEKWDLAIDDESEDGDFDLNADWDIND